MEKMLGKRRVLIRRGVWDVSFEWRRRKTCGVILWEKERVLKIFGPPNPDSASQKTATKNSCDFPNLLRSLFRALIQGLTELPSFSHAGLNNKGEIFIFYRRNQFSEKRKSFCVCEIAACVCLWLVSVCKWDHHRRSGGGGSGKFKIIRLISSLASFPFSVYGKWFLPLPLLPSRNGRNFFCLERTVVGAEMRKMGSKKWISPKGKQPSRKPSCVVYSLFLDGVGLSKFGKIW